MLSHKTQEQINPYEELKNLINDDLKKANQLILSFAESEVELIPTITNHLTTAGGKRLRPILTIACGKLFGENNDSCIQLATAVEFIHTATLLHDDVIDESPLRRNVPTANNIWGNKASILVGDYLLSQSFRLMLQAESIGALKMLADTTLKITESEVWQLDLINNIELSVNEYIKLVTGKTAVLFGAACAVSAITHNQSQEVTDNLYSYGLNLGICFQIMDDLLDYYPENEKFGKTVGNDFFEGKITLPFIIAYENADCVDKKNMSELMLRPNKSKEALGEMLKYFHKYNALDKSSNLALQYSIKGEEYLNLWQDSEMGKALQSVIRYSVKRSC